MAGREPVTSRIQQQAQEGHAFFLSITIVSELYFAVYASKRRQQNLANLQNLLEGITILDFDMNVAEEYGRIKAEQKAKGRPIPGTDAQIAAVARLYNLVVLSADRHFSYIDHLTVENWLA